jgi:hypothetical protein
LVVSKQPLLLLSLIKTNDMETQSKKKILNIYNKNEALDYPYGRLRTAAYFSAEFKPKFGFRSVFQTINPKTGKLNKPKYGTYYTFLCVYQNPDNGYYQYYGFNPNSFDSVNRLCKFLAANNEALGILDKEMVKDICGTLSLVIRASAMYCPVGKENTAKLIAIIDAPTKALIEGFKTGVIDFSTVVVDEEAIEKLKAEAAKPNTAVAA